MIRDRAFWEWWEAKNILSQPADFGRNLRLLEAMYAHASSLGAFPVPEPLAGLETKIRLARALNVRPASGKNRPGT
jgi:hypothetical protein